MQVVVVDEPRRDGAREVVRVDGGDPHAREGEFVTFAVLFEGITVTSMQAFIYPTKALC